jgi:hypothetical protein
MSAKILVLDLERVPAWTKPLPVWDMQGLKNKYLSPDDIESWGRTICLAYRWGWTGKVQFIAEWQEGGREGYLAAAKALLEEADVLVGHNSKGFDFPHLQGDLLMAGYGAVPPLKHIDTLLLARKHANWEANHLDTLTKRFGIPAKTDKYRISMATAAVAGDPKAQREIERYNKGDVRASTGLALKLLPLSTVNLGLFAEDPARPSCTVCESSRYLQRRGVAVKEALRYPRYQCQKCGKWQTSKTPLKDPETGRQASVEMRPL